MVKIAFSVAPIVAIWGLSFAFAWCTTPARRGVLRRRRRDLSAPAAAPEGGVVDLSRMVAARLVGVRVGSLVRGIADLLLVSAVLLDVGAIVKLAGLASAIWIHNRWQFPANLAYHRLTGDISLAFHTRAWTYVFPSHRRGKLWHLRTTLGSSVLMIVGIAFLLCSGLALAIHSDALVTGVPGLYVRHSGLPVWAVASITFAAGGALAWCGVRLERRARRAAMRRETALVPVAGEEQPPVVFLRPFGAESLMVPAHPSPRREGLAGLLSRRVDFIEDVVTWLLWSLGNVVAVADPRRPSLATVGAAHHLVPLDEDWKEAVSGLLERSAAIVLMPGSSAGVAWELRHVLDSPELLRKSLFVNPEPRIATEGFLAAVGASPRQAAAARDRDLLPLAATIEPAGVTLLCSSLAEDLDIESAVEWFLHRQMLRPEQLGPFALGGVAAG